MEPVSDDPGAAGTGESEEVVGEAGVGEREEMPAKEQEAREAQEAGETREAGRAGRKKEAKGGFLGSGRMVGVVALMLITAGVVIYTMFSRGGLWGGTVAVSVADSGNANGMDSAAGKAGSRQVAAPRNGADSAVSGAGAGSGAAGVGAGVGAAVGGGKKGLADSLYARLYKPYMRGDDPVEVRVYYQDYKTGNYTGVLAAGDSAVMKIPAQKLLARDYMRLYVGLSYLATGDGRDAVTELGGVVFRTKPGDILYETARWYLALAWLKRNDVDAGEAENKALGVAREIAQGYSRYREPARELVRTLGR